MRRSGEQATWPSYKSTKPATSAIDCGDAQRLPPQLRFIVAEELELDGLGIAFEIAEHVLQHLDELDAHARHQPASCWRVRSITSAMPSR